MNLYVLFSILGIKRIQEIKSWISWLKPSKLKIREDTETKGRILEESWRKSMEDVNSCISLSISMVLDRFWKKQVRRKSFGHLKEFLDFGRLDLLSLIGLYYKVKGWIVRSRLHKTCRWLKIIKFNIRFAQKTSPNDLSKSRWICWSEL